MQFSVVLFQKPGFGVVFCFLFPRVVAFLSVLQLCSLSSFEKPGFSAVTSVVLRGIILSDVHHSAFRKRWKRCSTTGRDIELYPKIRHSCCLSSMTTSRRRRSLPRVQIQQHIFHQATQPKRYQLSQCSVLVQFIMLWRC